MGLLHSIFGDVLIQITSGDLTGLLKILSDHNIMLFHIQYENELSAEMSISYKDYIKLQKIVHKKGDQCRVIKITGIPYILQKIPKRSIIIGMMLFLLFLTCYIPTKIFFFDINGNTFISDEQILEKLQQNGLYFGSNRTDISSEKIKNALIQDLPDLSWVGVTTSGCVAYINVQENTSTDSKKEEPKICSIVAAIDGVVEEITTLAGTPLCRPGQAVKSGQVLISGYEDRGLVLKAVAAEGEVYAKTMHSIEVVTPTKADIRGKQTNKRVSYGLQIGKKIINFTKDSSIYPTTCVKMYDRVYLTLPGGYELPVCLIREEYIYYQTELDDISQTKDRWLELFAQSYIKDLMLAGQVLQEKSELYADDAVMIYKAIYFCREQIGIRKYEEILN